MGKENVFMFYFQRPPAVPLHPDVTFRNFPRGRQSQLTEAERFSRFWPKIVKSQTSL